MFPDTAHPEGVFPVPIVEVSMSSTFEPAPQWQIGAAIKSLREEGYLILAGGLTVHDFGDFSSFNSDRAKPVSDLAVCHEKKANMINDFSYTISGTTKSFMPSTPKAQ